MAGDTRESAPKAPRSQSPGETEPSKVYEEFHSPPTSSNTLAPDSNQNTVGSKANPTLTDAIQTVRLQDFTQVHMYPCVRESLLMGIAAGFGVGGVRSLLGGELSLPSSLYLNFSFLMQEL